MTLKNQIAHLAETFAADVLRAIRGASLQELMMGGGEIPIPLAKMGGTTAGNPGPRRKRGRLARRSPADIDAVIVRIVGTLKENKKGLRSEELQTVLKLAKKEITGPLVQALAAKKITKKGQKRSTTYFA